MNDAPVIDLHVHYYTDQYIDAVKASKRIDTYRGFAKTWVLGLLVSVGCIMSRGVRGRRSCVGW